MEGKIAEDFPKSFDVIIIGAGISGINAAHHIQQQLPDLRYAILEGRDKIGGTWDLFRYPGIRSDTDLHTFGYGWEPWTEKRAIADGDAIAQYLRNTAKKDGIDAHIRFDHLVTAANWNSKSQHWEVSVKTNKTRQLAYHGRILILGTGYYDYTEPLSPSIPGLQDQFKGTVIHPQFWPEDIDYAKKRIVIIGSGATAITLLPNLAKAAGHVTMLQRSPTYILSINNETGNSWIHKLLPASWSFKLSRIIFMWMTALIYYLCRAFPNRARSMLQGGVAQQLPEHVPLDPHFQPTYEPWDQRLCFTPDGDFFEAMRNGNATIETGRIATMTEDSIVLESGVRLKADIIITATGLKLQIGGRIKFSLENDPIDLTSRYAWQSTLLQDIPNLAFMFGYANASWTLGAETSAQLVCRLLKRMQNRKFSSVTPLLPSSSFIQPRMIWDLKSTYFQQAQTRLPTCGHIGPWRGRTNYLVDLWRAKYGSITEDLQFDRGTEVR